MSNLDYIKSYMIKLGVDIDSKDMMKWDNSLKKMDQSFGQVVKNLTEKVWKAATFPATLAAGIYKFSSSIARADLELQKMANRMYMSRDSAKALKTTLDSMGLDMDDLQDVALSPELTSQYRQLISLSKQLSTPQDVKDSLKSIRAIGFEFSKLNTTFSYFMERVVHFIYRSVAGPGKKFYKFLQEFNTKFAKNITSWAKTLGEMLGGIVRLALRLFDTLSYMVNKVQELWRGLDNITKTILKGIGVIGLALKASPIWLALVLLDDWMGYKQGIESSRTLKPIWDWMSDQGNNPDSMTNKILKVLSDLWQSIKNINFKPLMDKLVKLDNAIRNLNLETVINWGKDVLNWVKEFLADFGKRLWEAIKEVLQNIIDWLPWNRNKSKSSKSSTGSSNVINKAVDWIKDIIGINPVDKNLDITAKLIKPLPPILQTMTPWAPGELDRIRNLSNNQTITPWGMKQDFGNLPLNPWTTGKAPAINQTFNISVTADNPVQFVDEVSTLIRNNKSRLV